MSDAAIDVPADIGATITSPDAYAQDVPINEAYRWLRANNPLGRVTIEGSSPFWLVTKHADLLEVSRQNALFASGERSLMYADLAGEERHRTSTARQARSVIQLDAPEHSKYRRLTQSWFMPANLKKLEERSREIAREHVDRMVERGGECDFAREIALTYPLRVIMEILGVEPQYEPLMLKLTQELFGSEDPDINEGTGTATSAIDPVAEMQKTIGQIHGFFATITADRRVTPREDLASVIANGTIDGAPISDGDALGYYGIIATAGHDTTTSSIAGAVWGMCEYPETFAALKANPSLIPGLVDEAIRWTSPVKHFMRTATADTELRGRPIARGDWLWLGYPSGNRDEEVFADPDRFDPTRKPNPLISFGYGAHMCLGQHLARMEMRIFFEELLPRLDTLAFAGTPRRVRSTLVGGPKSLPIGYRIV